MGNIIPGTAVSLACVGILDGLFKLDGRTGDGTLGFAPTTVEPFTGSRWLARPVPNAPPNQILLECLGDVDGPRFLNGGTEDGGVGLAPSTDLPFTGTLWEIVDAGRSDFVNLRCLGASSEGLNVRFLHGIMENRSVNLVQQPGDDLAADWEVVDAQPIPKGGPGETSAATVDSPSVALNRVGVGGPASICMACARSLTFQSNLVLKWRKFRVEL